MKKVLSMVMALIMLLSMVSLAGAESTLPYEAGTLLRMATGYNNSKTGLRFDPDIAKDGITLADGKTYNSGDFKPTWVTVMEKLNIQIEDKYQGNGAGKEFDYWKEQMDQVDVLSVHHRQRRERRNLLQPLFRRCGRHRADAPDAR